jgi:hypothetical protein
MRQLVVLLIALLALFTFIRDYPSATPSAAQGTTPSSQAEIRSSLIQ